MGEKPPPNVSWSSVEVVALDKDRVVVDTAMRLDVAVAGLVGEGLAGLPARLAAHVVVTCMHMHMQSGGSHAPRVLVSLCFCCPVLGLTSPLYSHSHRVACVRERLDFLLLLVRVP